MQILVVEDSPVYRQLLTSYLQEWGFPFKITKDGSEVPRLPWGLRGFRMYTPIGNLAGEILGWAWIQT